MNQAHRELAQQQAQRDGTGPRPAFGLAIELGAKQSLYVGGTWGDRVRYHRSMAGLMREQGFEELARSHEVVANDDPPGCDCEACGRREEEIARVERRKEKIHGHAG